VDPFLILYLIGAVLGLWASAKIIAAIWHAEEDVELTLIVGWCPIALAAIPFVGYVQWLGWIIWRWHRVLGYYLQRMPTFGVTSKIEPEPSPEDKRKAKELAKKRQALRDVADLILLEIDTDNPITDPAEAKRVLDEDYHQFDRHNGGPVLTNAEKYKIKAALGEKDDPESPQGWLLRNRSLEDRYF
jgi:hypothetical protein